MASVLALAALSKATPTVKLKSDTASVFALANLL